MLGCDRYTNRESARMRPQGLNQRAEFNRLGPGSEDNQDSNAPILAHRIGPAARQSCYLTERSYLIAGGPKPTSPQDRRPNGATRAPLVALPTLPPDSSFADRTDALRTVTFYMALALIFVRFSLLQEIQLYTMHFKAYLLYVFGIPAIMGVVLAGGLRRTLSARPAYYWTGYALWVLAAVPFSSWRGASVQFVWYFFRTDFMMLFVVAGLVVSWRECRIVLRTLAAATVVNLLTARLFSASDEGRMTLEWRGSVADPNDFAAILLLGLPFLLLVVFNSKSRLLKFAALAGITFGIVVIFKTGSRGALLALIADTLFLFFRANHRQRIALVCCVPLILLLVVAIVPSELLQRIHSFSASDENASAEALASSTARNYLLHKSVEYTFEFPIFGVGPNQFASYEGTHNAVFGWHGMWHDTHNTFTQASSECGIPAGILLIASWVSSFLLVNRTYRKARSRPECRDIQAATFCLMLSIVGFCAAITFLNFAYFFYGPAMGGLAIAIARAANYEFTRRNSAAPAMATAAG